MNATGIGGSALGRNACGDDAADSPVVSIAGSSDQYFLGVVVGYTL